MAIKTFNAKNGVSVGTSLTDVIDASGNWIGVNIPNSKLANSTITIAGTSTALGTSIALDTITGVSTGGFLARTAANTLTARTITGTAGQITVTNGDGVAGAPTISLPAVITQATRFSTSPLAVGDDAGTNAFFIANGTAGNVRGLALRTAGLDRWWMVANATAEGGSNAGSNFQLTAYNDAGSTIDSPIGIARVAGGAMTLTRPTNFTSTTASTSTTTGSATFGGGIGVAGAGYFGTGVRAISSSVGAYRGLVTDGGLFTTVTGDANNRFYVAAGGTVWWGSGAAGEDTNLYRSAANTLRTDDAFIVGGNLTFGTSGSILNGTTGSIGLTATGTNQSISLAPTGTGTLNVLHSEDVANPILASFMNAGATTAGRYNEIRFGKSIAAGGAGAIGYVSDTVTPTNGRVYLVNYGDSQDTKGLQIVKTSGNVLLGTTTDSSNGRLQLATHTTSAGGIGFGTDMMLYRGAGRLLNVQSSVTNARAEFDNQTSSEAVTLWLAGSTTYGSSGFAPLGVGFKVGTASTAFGGFGAFFNSANTASPSLNDYFINSHAAPFARFSATAVTVPQTTNSTSPTTGALVVTGGLGVSGAVFTATTLDSGGNVFAGTRTASSGNGGQMRFRDDTGTSRWLTGILGTAANTSYSVYDVANSAELFKVTSGTLGTSVVSVFGTTDRTYATGATGALTVAGGASITKGLQVGIGSSETFPLNTGGSGGTNFVSIGGGATAKVQGFTNAVAATTLSLQPSGGALSVGSSATIATFNGTTASTSTTTGSLITAGGIGVAGAQFLGGNLTFGTSGSVLNGTTGSIGLNATGTNQPISFITTGTGATFLSRAPALGLSVSNTAAANGAGYTPLSGVNLVHQLAVVNQGTGHASSPYGAIGFFNARDTNTYDTSFASIAGGKENGTAGNVAGFLDIFTARADTTGARAMRINSAQNVLLGTTTDSSNGRLQLATHTTSAGGIGFGTDTSLYRFGAGNLQVATTGNPLNFDLVKDAGQVGLIRVFSGGGRRWAFGGDGTAETGSNAGTHFVLNAYDDANVFIDRPISLLRVAGGLMTVARPLSVTSTTASTSTTTGALTVAGGMSSQGAAWHGGQVTSSLGAGQSGFIASSSAGQTRNVRFQTAASDRWVAYVDASAESGSNAGSDFYLARYTDAGAFAGNSIGISRATGLVTFGTTGTAVSVAGTTPSTSTTSGALTVAGGAGFAGAGYFGGNVRIAETAATYGLTARLRVDSPNTNVGPAIAAFGDSVGRVMYLYEVGHIASTSGASLAFNVVTGTGFSLGVGTSGGASGGTFQITAPTLTALLNTTEATAAGAGSVTTAGGIYAAKRVVTATSFVHGVQTFTGSGAASSTTGVSAITSSGAAQAISLADGVEGQQKTIIHKADGGSIVITPTTKTGFSSVTLEDAGESVTMIFLSTTGWNIIGNNGATITP